jgi:hypothetical protein
MLGASLLAIASAFALSASLSRDAPARVAPIAFGLNALGFVLEGLAFASALGVVAMALYLQVTSMLPVLASSFWSAINERFDPFAAKQSVPHMAAAGALAGVAGGLAAERIASLAHVGWVLPLLSLSCAFCM